jgi:hypothetical protein
MSKQPVSNSVTIDVSLCSVYVDLTAYNGCINLLRNTHIIVILSEVRLSPLGTAATTGLLYQPRMIDDGDCGAVGGIKIGGGNRSTRRKLAPAPLCPPQIPLDQTRD